jgi:Tfp pilus assembly protein PilW
MVANPGRPQRRHFESESGPEHRRSKSEGGFTLVEFLIAALMMSIVLGGTVGLATRIQEGYQSQLDDMVVEQEARYALDWIARDLRSADSDPYGVIAANQGIILDPNGGADNNDSIRVQADINPVNGAIAGANSGENVTIAISGNAGDVNRAITRADTGAAATPMTDTIFTDLSFTYLDRNRAVTATPDLVAYIQVQVTARSRGRNTSTGFTTSTLATEVRVRTHD